MRYTYADVMPFGVTVPYNGYEHPLYGPCDIEVAECDGKPFVRGGWTLLMQPERFRCIQGVVDGLQRVFEKIGERGEISAYVWERDGKRVFEVYRDDALDVTFAADNREALEVFCDDQDFDVSRVKAKVRCIQAM